jgi:hypothetical protein
MATRFMSSCFGVVALVVALTGTAMAGANANGKIAVHIKAYPTSCTKGYPTFTSCSQIRTTYSGGDAHVMPVFYDLAEYTAVEVGLNFAAYCSNSWVKCKGDMSVGIIIRSADAADQPVDRRGTYVSWNTCQNSWAVAPGYLWTCSSSPSRFCPAPNPATGKFGFEDCASVPGPSYDDPVLVSCGGMQGAVGDDPCGPTDTEPTTWGAIKSIFR